jgi:hypothetical protein
MRARAGRRWPRWGVDEVRGKVLRAGQQRQNQRCAGSAQSVSQRNKKEETKIEAIKRGPASFVRKASQHRLSYLSRQASRGACLVEVSKQTSSRSQTKRLPLPHNNLLSKHTRAQFPFQAQSTPNSLVVLDPILLIRSPSLSPSPALSSASPHSLHLLRGPPACASQFVVPFSFIQTNHVVRIRTCLTSTSASILGSGQQYFSEQLC